MNVKSLRDQAKTEGGLRDVLEERMKNSTNEQLVTQLKHILAMIDNEEDEAGMRRGIHQEQDQVIEEDEAEDDEDYEGNHHD